MKKIVFPLVAVALSAAALTSTASAHVRVLHSPLHPSVTVVDVEDLKLTPLPEPRPLPFPFGLPIPLPRPIPLPDPCLSCPPMPLDHFPGTRMLIIR